MDSKMNERFIELMNEANKTAGFTFSMDQAKPVHDLMEKFAELIVKECAQVCLEQRDPANLNYKPSVKFAEAVKQHFGVE
jgi:hypothetical protein